MGTWRCFASSVPDSMAKTLRIPPWVFRCHTRVPMLLPCRSLETDSSPVCASRGRTIVRTRLASLVPRVFRIGLQDPWFGIPLADSLLRGRWRGQSIPRLCPEADITSRETLFAFKFSRGGSWNLDLGIFLLRQDGIWDEVRLDLFIFPCQVLRAYRVISSIPTLSLCVIPLLSSKITSLAFFMLPKPAMSRKTDMGLSRLEIVTEAGPSNTSPTTPSSSLSTPRSPPPVACTWEGGAKGHSRRPSTVSSAVSPATQRKFSYPSHVLGAHGQSSAAVTPDTPPKTPPSQAPDQVLDGHASTHDIEKAEPDSGVLTVSPFPPLLFMIHHSQVVLHLFYLPFRKRKEAYPNSPCSNPSFFLQFNLHLSRN
jgi:hypothetical protein